MRILCLISLAALVGCSSQPQVAAPAKPIPAVAVAKEAPAAPVAMAATQNEDEYTPPAGYRRKVDNGHIYYCAKVKVLGSRFPKEDCRTQAQLEQLEAEKAEMRDEIANQQRNCTGKVGCTGGT